MRLTLVAVGRLKPGPEQTLVTRYLARLPWPITVRELVPKPTRATAAERRRDEADALLTALPPGAVLAALDECGPSETSEAFARRLVAWRDRGVQDLVFAIGGPDGFDDRVRDRADRLIAFGPMTWPHGLVRVLLAEQLYRAASLSAGHPYHRG